MKISTRGRYALRIMVDLAEHKEEGYIPLKAMSERQYISLKYVENIMSSLSKAGLVDAKNGKSGGYRLNRKPEDYHLDEILIVTEGDLAPVECLSCEINTCKRKDNCKTLPMWKEFYKVISDYFKSISLSSLLTNDGRYYFGDGI